MEKTIYLEIDEEITSAIDKVKKAEEKEVILVVPKGATLLQSVINLKLLKKAAEAAKKEISIVTNDRIGKTIALQVGIKVFNHIDRSGKPQGIEELDEPVIKEESDEKESDGPLITLKHKDSKENKDSLKKAYYSEAEDEGDNEEETEEVGEAVAAFAKKEIEANAEEDDGTGERERIHIASHRLLWSVFLGIPLLVSGLAYAFVPKAEVAIKVRSEKLPIDTAFVVDKEAPKVDALVKVLPGRFISDEKEEAKEFTATGKKNIGDKASGKVTLYNAYDSDPMILIQGTSLQATDGKVFKLVKDVSVPGGTATIENGQPRINPGSISADVEAAEPGDSYNIGPTNFTVPKLGIAQVYGKSAGSMAGGFTKEITVVSQADVDKAKADFEKEVVAKHKGEIGAQNKGYTVVPDAVQVSVGEAVSEPAVGQEAEKFKIKLKANWKAVLFKEGDLKLLLEKIQEKEVPAEKEVYTSQIDPSKFALTSKFDKEFTEADFKFSAQVDLIPKLDIQKIQKSLAFKNAKTVESELRGYQSVESVSFKFFPFKMSKLPLMPKNITVKLEVLK